MAQFFAFCGTHGALVGGSDSECVPYPPGGSSLIGWDDHDLELLEFTGTSFAGSRGRP
jgi:hypothetical protein